MAEIYSKACRVVTWLGEAADDSDQALEEIAISARQSNITSFSDEQSTHSPHSRFPIALFRSPIPLYATTVEIEHTPNNRMNPTAIFALLRRPWFQRIWNLVRSVTDLMRESIFRPKFATSSSNYYSLNIRPLVELIETYYAHQASDDRDRVYALLAMSSDNPVSRGLLPDYTISWAQLFVQLVKFLLCEQTSVDICQTRRMVVIKSKGRVLGTVRSARRTSWNHTQILEVDSLPFVIHPEKYDIKEWELPAARKNIQAGDIIVF
ncbi:hypothetical protein SS1G_03889 [Sclerotinia sclerotiorum 1980 UF-70]|uniref:Heterokaryon incompatibility domain-containing protein n=1 Tax=Sclerotinia sclerotiorum (strain ATCC 18683 / 1980 / Ss-1) TaxID=665079 RepID=A7EEZ8_SCLS1|nr:hypothetical protein SS1G_03889 [Sclerotinia sclerotiorum 1980 UF-70]EDO01414.1 hypothetical protein SS1G_03889 [Sclerotinia sclerotiorum 1980 UF-70]